MTQSAWAVELNDENPDPRVSCVVLVDISLSMRGEPIAALERGYAAFTQYLNTDTLASKRVEVAVVTFGEVATVLVPMQEARGLQPAHFIADGRTNMTAAFTWPWTSSKIGNPPIRRQGCSITARGS